MENRRNIALFFAAYFLEGLCFYGPVATLYRQAAGLTLLEIGTLESVSVAVMLLLELPWGWAADRLGHRRVIVVCTALYALSKVVFWRADGLWDFLLEPHPRPAAGGSGPFQRDGAVCGCLSQPAPVSALRHFPPVVWPALYPCGLGGHSRWVVPPPHGADGAAGWRCAPDGRRRSPLPGDGHLSPALGIGGGDHGPSGGGCAL